MKETEILSAVVLHEGWEMDNRAWIIEKGDGSIEMRSTNHGSECTMEMEMLQKEIKKTQESLQSLIKLRDKYFEYNPAAASAYSSPSLTALELSNK